MDSSDTKAQKPTYQELQNYYFNNRKYFDELAQYYYDNDIEYYKAYILPQYSQLLAGEIRCPFCQRNVRPLNTSRISTGGTILIIVGILFSPILIGILLIFIGIGMKDYNKLCPFCKMKLS